MDQNLGQQPRRKIPWWLIIIGVIAINRAVTIYNHQTSASSGAPTARTSTAASNFTVSTSSQEGEQAADDACSSAVNRSETIASKADSIAYMKTNAAHIIEVCSTAYQDGLKDADQDSGDAHFLDENNAAVDEEMVSAAMWFGGDKAGSKEADDKAVSLARDVIANSHTPQLVKSAKETVREITGPVTPKK